MEQSDSEFVEAVKGLARTSFAGRAAATDREGAFPHENMAELRALRVPAMGLPKTFGGLGIGPEAQTRIIEEIAYADASTAVALNMHLLAADFLVFLPPFPRRVVVLGDVVANGATL